MWCCKTTHCSKETQPRPEIPAGRRQVGPAARPTRGHHLFRPLLAWILTGWQSTCLALAHAEDWAWLVDHSVQIGQDKCLVILGIRLAALPGTALVASDLELIALVPRPSWTAPEVDATLQKAVAEAGVPRVIVDDHGGDRTGGVRLFQERHPETLEVDAIGHKAACVLERRLESDPRWPEFHWQVGPTRCAIQQTELAFLVPPGPRPKARFTNLEPLLAWGRKVVGILEAPSAEVLGWVSVERLHEKLGWLLDLRDGLDEWSQWPAVVGFVICRGLDRGAARDLIAALPGSFGVWRRNWSGSCNRNRARLASRNGCRAAPRCWNRASANSRRWGRSRHGADSPGWS